MSGPTTVRKAVSRAWCETAANELQNAIAVGDGDSYIEYKMTPTCADIAREAHNTHASLVNSVLAGVRPFAITIGSFRQPKETSRSPSEPSGNVYFAIALTALDAQTGILNFFPEDTEGGGVEELDPGDGIICRGENVRGRGAGQGGIVLMMCYQVKNGR